MTQKMIFISTNHPYLRFSRKDANNILRLIYKKERKELPTIAIVFTYNNFIKKINRDFLRHNYTTDVIAFPLGDDAGVEAEIYLNLDAAKRQANKYKISYSEEVKRLLVHAVLHLLGYHDKKMRESKQMNGRQEMYMELIKQNIKKEAEIASIET
jgi:rRNA maturation RNase YbeY